MEEKIIIVGGGIAGLSAAQAARETNSQARIYLLCGEKRLPYYRTRICEVFAGLDIDKLVVRNHQWFIDMDIEVVYDRVTSINPELKQVRFTDGSFLAYDKLVLATGALGNSLEVEGSNRENVLALRTLADVAKVERFPGPVVIIGDGLLGLEAAWHLSRAGRSVVIVGRNQRLLAHQLDKEGSVFFLNIVENAGVRVALNGSLEQIDDEMVMLADGRGFPAGVVIFAAGIKSVFKLAKAINVEANRAIVVDRQMQTSLPDIYAAGDCVEYQGRVYGLWTAAMAQGGVAGANAAGGERSYQPERPSYMMNAMGTKVWSYGDISVEEGLAARDREQRQFIKLFFADNRLVGAELIGDTTKMIAIRKAVDQGISRAEAESSFLTIAGVQTNNIDREE